MALIRDLDDLLKEDKPTDLRRLMDFIDSLTAEVPEEEWKKLPPDLSEFHDEYAAGLRKYPA